MDPHGCHNALVGLCSAALPTCLAVLASNRAAWQDAVVRRKRAPTLIMTTVLALAAATSVVVGLAGT
jgi:hypothetical protein